MKVFVILSVVLAVAFAAPGVKFVDSNEESPSLRKIVSHCVNSEDILTCLSVKGITALNRAARSPSIEVLSGVSFNRDPSVSARNAKAISENEIIDSLPAESTDRTSRLFDLAMDSLTNFLESHSLEVKFPQETTQEVARAIEEGRGKLKKLAGPLLLAVGAKLIALVPLFLGGLIFLAVKALVVSKLAFVLAAILGLQRLGSGAGGLNLLGKVANGVQGWSSAAQPAPAWPSTSNVGSSYPYARTYENAQDLAYSGYSNGEITSNQQ